MGGSKTTDDALIGRRKVEKEGVIEREEGREEKRERDQEALLNTCNCCLLD